MSSWGGHRSIGRHRVCNYCITVTSSMVNNNMTAQEFDAGLLTEKKYLTRNGQIYGCTYLEDS